MSTATEPTRADLPTDDERACLRALTDLVDTARHRARVARWKRAPARERHFEGIAHTLDRARTRLVEDGSDYIEAAWAFVDAARKMLAA